jgi:hypothetical protein
MAGFRSPHRRPIAKTAHARGQFARLETADARGQFARLETAEKEDCKSSAMAADPLRQLVLPATQVPVAAWHAQSSVTIEPGTSSPAAHLGEIFAIKISCCDAPA